MGLKHHPRVVTNGLVYYLDAANTRSYSGSGLTANGLIGGINATLVNGVGFSSANNGSFSFDGTNDYLSVPSSSIFNLASNDCSIEVVTFFNSSTSSDNTYRPIFVIGSSGNTYLSLSKWRSGIGNGVYLDYSVTGSRYTITTTNSVPSPAVLNTITSPLFDVNNKWTHFLIQVSSNVMTLYINSVALGSVNLTARWNTSLDLVIGAWAGDYMSGNIPLFKIYNRALTAQEVLQNYNATKKRYGL
jgi:hypothetical protein